MSQIFRALQRVLPAIFVPQTGNALVFSVFVVSLFASKGIRLVTHAIAIPPIALVFYLPTFLFFDFLAICVSRLLLWWPFRRGNRWWFLVIVPSTLGCLLSLIALGAASSQLSFFIETGGELEWREASSYATSKDGLKVLLTGLIPMLVSGAVIIGGSWLLSNLLYNAFGALLTNIGNNLLFGTFSPSTREGARRTDSNQSLLISFIISLHPGQQVRHCQVLHTPKANPSRNPSPPQRQILQECRSWRVRARSRSRRRG